MLSLRFSRREEAGPAEKAGKQGVFVRGDAGLRRFHPKHGLTTYAELSRLNQRGVHFVTIRRRGPRLVQRLLRRPASEWTGAVIDIPKRRQKRIRYLDQPVGLRGYAGALRQIAVTGLGARDRRCS